MTAKNRPEPTTAYEVGKYYDYNTPRFLSYGTQRKTGTIHRPVWGAGVENETQALHFVHDLILQEARTLMHRRAGRLQAVDLGCGVGASLFYLSRRLGKGFSAVGMTISPVQARMAAFEGGQDSKTTGCRFVIGDFSAPPLTRDFDLAFSIEALAHSDNPSSYFQAVGKLLKPGGRLVLCDDFLSEESAAGKLDSRQRNWLEMYRWGWGVRGLGSPGRAASLGESSGLQILVEHDLTTALRLRPLPERLLYPAASIVQRLAARNYYWRSVLGGQALQLCLAQGLVTYRFMVFERVE